jgi:hypothetical protein
VPSAVARLAANRLPCAVVARVAPSMMNRRRVYRPVLIDPEVLAHTWIVGIRQVRNQLPNGEPRRLARLKLPFMTACLYLDAEGEHSR